MTEKIVIWQGFPDEQRVQAAELYDSAFGAKLAIAIPETAARQALLGEAFVPTRAFVALSDGEMVGVAGFKDAQGSFTDGISFQLLRKHLGFVGSLRAAVILALFDRKETAGQLLMDGIAVAPSVRGHGIGTRLLERLLEYALIEGYRTVRLDVIDTNDAARRLYERVGFVPVKTQHFPYMKWLLQFAASTEMVYILRNEEPITA